MKSVKYLEFWTIFIKYDILRTEKNLPRSIRYSDHLTGEIGFTVKEKLSKYGKKK